MGWLRYRAPQPDDLEHRLYLGQRVSFYWHRAQADLRGDYGAHIGPWYVRVSTWQLCIANMQRAMEAPKGTLLYFMHGRFGIRRGARGTWRDDGSLVIAGRKVWPRVTEGNAAA